MTVLRKARERDGETSPLLLRSHSTLTTKSQLSHRAESWRKSRRIVYTMMLVVLLIGCGENWMETPQTRIFEAIICYKYYEREDPSKIEIGRSLIGAGAIGGVPERLCKVEEVQSELAMLRGWQIFFEGIPSLVLAIPVGWLADRYGRKPLMMLGLLGFTLKAFWWQIVSWNFQAFDIKWAWLSAVFASIGGGGSMTASLAFVVLSDVTPEEERGAVFLRVGACNLVPSVVMPPLAAWLMQYSPWIPNLGGLALDVSSIIGCALVPETLNFLEGAKRPGHSRTNTAESTVLPPPPDPAPTQQPISLNTANMWLKNLQGASAFLTDDWRIPALIAPFLIHMLLGISGTLVIQYMSKRYDITFAQATLVATVRSIMVAIVLFLFLPVISEALMQRLNLSAQKKDLYLARASQIFLSIGWFAFGLAPSIPFAAVTLVFASLGTGAPFVLRSFLTSLLKQDQIARAFSVITIVDTVGAMVGAPLLAGLLKKGLKMGGGWVGLPFLFTGLLAAVLSVVLFFVNVRKGEDTSPDFEEEEGLVGR